jgi:hypothetical protein
MNCIDPAHSVALENLAVRQNAVRVPDAVKRDAWWRSTACWRCHLPRTRR